MPTVSSRLFKPSCGVKRTMLGTLAAITVAGTVVANPKPVTYALKPEAISVSSVIIAGFDRVDRAKTTFGKLEWRGGLVLTAAPAAFGGWSGLSVDADGKAFVAVSDAGTWMTGTLTYADGRLAGVADTRLGAIVALDGKALNRWRYRDAEAVTLASGTLQSGSLLIAFEQKNRIGHFRIGKAGLSQPSDYLKMPPELKAKRGNDGIEAVTVMRGGPMRGAVLALAESVETKAGHHAGWIWQGKEPKPFALRRHGGFNVTDVASLGNGDLLVLERYFRWTEGLKVRLRRVAAADVKPGAVADGEVLLEADLAQDIDNLEGMGVHVNADGETIVTLISDDNFNRLLQRTILLQFALTDAAPERTAGP